MYRAMYRKLARPIQRQCVLASALQSKDQLAAIW
jgi:hypothetical protein